MIIAPDECSFVASRSRCAPTKSKRHVNGERDPLWRDDSTGRTADQRPSRRTERALRISEGAGIIEGLVPRHGECIRDIEKPRRLRKYVKPSVPAPPTTHPEPEKSWGGPETSVICPRRSANPMRFLMSVCVFEPAGPTPRYTKPIHKLALGGVRSGGALQATEQIQDQYDDENCAQDAVRPVAISIAARRERSH